MTSSFDGVFGPRKTSRLCGVESCTDALIFRKELTIRRRFAGQLRVTIRSAFNLEYADWQTFLGNKPLVEALLSRLPHQCHTVRIDGPSLREPQD